MSEAAKQRYQLQHRFVHFAATSVAFVSAPSPRDLASREMSVRISTHQHPTAPGVFRARLPEQHALIVDGMRLADQIESDSEQFLGGALDNMNETVDVSSPLVSLHVGEACLPLNCPCF